MEAAATAAVLRGDVQAAAMAAVMSKKQRGERDSLTPRRDLLVPKAAARPKTAEPIRKKGRHVKVRTVVSSDDEEEDEQNDGTEQEEEEDEEEQNENEDSAEDSDSEHALQAQARPSQQNVSRHDNRLVGFDQGLEDRRNCSECGLILKDDQPRYRTCRSPRSTHPGSEQRWRGKYLFFHAHRWKENTSFFFYVPPILHPIFASKM